MKIWQNIVVVPVISLKTVIKHLEAGRKGGQHSGGNFKNDPQRASEAGKKGGQNSHGGGRKSDNS